MTGRKPTATGIKILNATAPKAARLERRRMPAAEGNLKPPQWFNDDQRERWEYYVANAPANVLKNVDRGMLLIYVLAEDRLLRATEEDQQFALGGEASTKFARIIDRQAAMMFRAGSELGFTPCSRAKLEAANPPETKDDWEDVA